MARVEIPHPVMQVLDGYFRPVADATVYVRMVADGTLAAVYATEVATTALTQPLASDAHGRIEAWVDEGAYNVDVSKPGVIEPYSQRIATGVGSHNTDAAAHPAIRSRIAVIEEAPLNAKAAPFNAVGDGVTDDTTALTNWLAAIAGKEGYLPPGTYLVTGAGLAGSAANTKIRGAGKGNSIIKYTGTGTALTWGTATTTPNVNLVMEGIRIDGTASGVGGLRLQQIQDFTLINVDVKGFSAGFGIWVNGSNSTVSIGCDVRQNNIGWRISDNANLNTYIGGQISGNDYGVQVQNASYANTWIGANIVVNDRAVYLIGGTLSTFDNCFFEANLAAQTNPASVWIGEIAGGLLASSANRIINCYFTEVDITYGIRVHRGSRNVIANNVHAGSGATHFVRCDTAAEDTILRDNVKSAAALLDDAGVRTVASGPGYPVPSVASASTITVPPGCDVASITGTTNILSVTGSHIGRIITLVFAGALTFTDGSNLRLAGNFVTAANSTITLRWDGTYWNEVSRSVN